MAISIVSPRFSFIQFNESDAVASCSHPDGSTCLPVYEDNDVWFQFIMRATTTEEADDLCNISTSGVTVGLDNGMVFSEQPERYRLNAYEVLFNWQHGLPNFQSTVNINTCFAIRVQVGEQTFDSNCLIRIPDDCYTSVIEYSSDENVFGFAYCGGVPVSEEVACQPEFVTFTNQSLLTIPYNAAMQSKFGDMPTVQVWIYNDNNELQNFNVAVTFDAYPVSEIYVDLGGPASGVLKIS